MTTSSVPTKTAMARSVRVTDRALVVELRDGRVVSVPLGWYPRLAEGLPRERRRWELLGPGIGVRWPDLDEDISIAGLLAGLPSGESAASLDEWRASRKKPAASAPRQPSRRANAAAKSRRRSRVAGG